MIASFQMGAILTESNKSLLLLHNDHGLWAGNGLVGWFYRVVRIS